MTTKEEKEYLDMIHKTSREHHIQTKLFSMVPLAAKFDLFTGHCEMCAIKLRSRPMYIMEIPNKFEKMLQIRYLCGYCASLHEKYIKFFLITKN